MTTTTAPAPAAAPSSAGSPKGIFGYYPLAMFVESALNPRKHFDPVKLAELTESVRASGVLTPAVARSVKGGKYELAAGHRRLRAAKAAGLAEIPAIVRDMSDAEFLEILSVENLQRDDVHPLEEAQGYKSLLTIDGYDVPKIAKRVGKSESYVYDRIKLLALIKPAQKLFLEDRFSAGHAILLARLKAKDQERCIDVDGGGDYRRSGTGGMWQSEGVAHPALGIEDSQVLEIDDGFTTLKPVSVRELQGWIDSYVRFDEADASQLEHVLPATAADIRTAIVEKAKVIKITRNLFVQPEAKIEGERTYGPRSWVRADGLADVDPEAPDETKKPSEVCEHSVLGLVVAGPGRGESFEVCIAKTKCMVHYGDVIRERNRREKEREQDSSPAAAKKTEKTERDEAKRAEREAAEAAQRERDQQAWQKARPEVLDRVALAVRKAPTGAKSPMGQQVMAMVQRGFWGLSQQSKKAEPYVPRGNTAATLVAHLIMCDLVDNQREHMLNDVRRLKLSVDVERIWKSFLPKEEKGASPAKAKAGKK